MKSKQFIDLYWKAVKAQYVNPIRGTVERGIRGIPQGGTISAILSNIYLHEFDLYMESMVNESLKSGKTSMENPEYKKIHTKISNLRQYFSPSYRYKRTLTEEQVEERKQSILKLEKERAKLPSKVRSKDGYRIYYVRYADDFLVGVNGSRKRAENVRDNIKSFLENNLLLKLNTEKTKITDSRKGAHFLGAIVKAHTSRTNDQHRRRNSKTQSTGRKVRARMPQGGIIALAPLDRIVHKLANQGMCRIVDLNNRQVIPTRKTAWMNIEL